MPSVLTTLLSNIPWGQVVDSAPKIAQGAGRLWETVKSRRSEAGAPAAAPDEAPPTELEQLQAQMQALHDEVRATAQLVKDLAEQNAQLVQRLQALQQAKARLAMAAGVGLAALAAAVLYLGWLR